MKKVEVSRWLVQKDNTINYDFLSHLYGLWPRKTGQIPGVRASLHLIIENKSNNENPISLVLKNGQFWLEQDPTTNE